MSRLALTMIVKNEEAHLANCLRSVTDVCDELIVVDTGSTDRTVEIATEFGATVFEFTWIDDFSAARNYALEQSRCEWNLVLDADEVLDPESIPALRAFLAQPPAIGRLQIISRFVQDGEVRFARDSISRLLPREVRFSGRVHEQVVSSLERIDTGIQVHHEGYFQTNKSDRNIPLLFKELESKPNDLYLLQHIAKEYRLTGQYDQADPYYARAYELATRSESFFPNFVVDYLYNLKSRGDLERAVQVLGDQQEALYGFADFQFVAGLLLMDWVYKTGQADLLPLIEQAYLAALEIGETSAYDSVLGTGSFYAAYNLGVYYEVLGQTETAKAYYHQAVEWGYQPAQARLNSM